MNSADLAKILEEHKLWVTSMRESGSRADLYEASLCGADLYEASLCGANLYEASLCGANLCGANLRKANLCGADLCGADLYEASLCGANLRKANLCGADLPDHTFVVMGEKYAITITNGEYVRAGCQNHTIEKWRKFSKQEIAEMGGRKALKFYPRLLDLIDFFISKGPRPEWLNQPESEECEE